MEPESSNISNERINSQNLKINKENIICKDGFCSMPNYKENLNINEEDENIFDPI